MVGIKVPQFPLVTEKQTPQLLFCLVVYGDSTDAVNISKNCHFLFRDLFIFVSAFASIRVTEM